MINEDVILDHSHYHDRRDLPQVMAVPPPRNRSLGSSITTITITIPKDDPNTYYGMPSTLKQINIVSGFMVGTDGTQLYVVSYAPSEDIITFSLDNEILFYF
jgi:hypothetical protein